MPEAIGMHVGTALKAYRDRLSPLGCGAVDVRVWTGDRLATADDPQVADLVLQRGWPDFDSSYDSDTVRPVWFAAASPPAFTLPDLRNKTLAEARQIAAAAGLAAPAAVADNQLVDDQASGDRTIAAQQPAAGTAMTGTDRLLLVLSARPTAPPPVDPAPPAALVASGALGGIATAAAARRLIRQRGTPDPAQPVPARPTMPDRDRNRIRVRPDIPLLHSAEGDTAKTWLTALLPLSAISAGALLTALADTHPDLTDWSQSNRVGALPPGRLARLVLASLPAAFAVTIEDLLLNSAGPGAGGRISLVNRPCIDVLNSDGSLRDSIVFSVEITLAPTIRALGGDRAPWILDMSVLIVGRTSNPSRVLLGDVRRVVDLAA
jgi:hypothetical protein